MSALKPKTSSVRSSRTKAGTEETQFSGTPIGETLRLAREERGVTLDGIANELMIRRFYLEALENGSFKDLPEQVYATGFVRNYAKYLGLDVQALAEQFKREAYGSRSAKVDLVMPEPVVHSVVPGRSALVSAIVILVVVIAAIIFFTQNGKVAPATIPEPAPEAAAEEAAAPEIVSSAPVTTTTSEEPAPAAEFTSATPAETAAPAAPVAEAPVVAAPQHRRVIEALQSSWVEIKDTSGKILFTNILKTGQLLPLPENTKVTLTTGNAGGLRLVLDGQPQAAFGQVNEVKRNLALEVPASAPMAISAAPAAAAMPAPVAPKAPVAATPSSAPVTFDQR